MYGEINFDSNTVNVKGFEGDVAQFGSDKDLVVIFHKGVKMNEIKSKEAGTPIFDQLDFVKVIHPGEPLNVYDQPVREMDKIRFRDQWKRYQDGSTQSVSGTPLAVLFPWQPEIVETLKYMQIHTVQQLANLSDTGKQNLMFGQNLSDKAKHYLQTVEKGREYHDLNNKLTAQETEIGELRRTIQDLQTREPVKAPESDEIKELRDTVQNLVKLASAPRRKPGRPPKLAAQFEATGG